MVKVEQEWNFNLDGAINHGPVILVGTNNCDGSKWTLEAILTDDGWVDAYKFEKVNFANATPKAWCHINYPF